MQDWRVGKIWPRGTDSAIIVAWMKAQNKKLKEAQAQKKDKEE